MNQIILHLNPGDSEDQKIDGLVKHVVTLSHTGVYSAELAKVLVELRVGAQACLKVEWNRVKQESKSGDHS